MRLADSDELLLQEPRPRVRARLQVKARAGGACVHEPRVPPALLRSPIPSDAELRAVEIAEKAAEAADALEWSRHAVKDQPPKFSDLASLQSAFLREHCQDLNTDLGLHVRLTHLELFADVRKRFLETCGSQVPSLCYHTAAPTNLGYYHNHSVPIISSMIPGSENEKPVAHGSVRESGIYTLKAGTADVWRAFSYPRGGPRQVLVCGVVERLGLESEAGNEAEEPSPLGPRCPQRARPQHRAHHRAQHLTMGRRPVGRDSGAVQDFGAARVIFDEDYIAPLFVAHLEDDDATLGDSEVLSWNRNRGGLQRVGKQQVLIGRSGERVWLPPKPESFEPLYKNPHKHHYRYQKRRAVAKDRERIRHFARKAKEFALVSAV